MSRKPKATGAGITTGPEPTVRCLVLVEALGVGPAVFRRTDDVRLPRSLAEKYEGAGFVRIRRTRLTSTETRDDMR